MLAALAALFLAVSLILEAAVHQVTLGRWSGLAGLVFLIAAVFAPYRPHPPSRRRVLSLYRHVPHPHIAHRREQGPVQVADVRPSGNAVARFNTRAAVIVTRGVGTMYCAYAFTLLALYGLPAGLKGGAAGFVQWASSQFIQLVLLPIIIVGSAVLAEASDRLAKRQFDDVEAILHEQAQAAEHLAAQDEKILAILDQLDVHTEGGIKAVLDAVNAFAAKPAPVEPTVHMESSLTLDETQIKQLVAAIQANLLAHGDGPEGAGV